MCHTFIQMLNHLIGLCLFNLIGYRLFMCGFCRLLIVNDNYYRLKNNTFCTKRRADPFAKNEQRYSFHKHSIDNAQLSSSNIIRDWGRFQMVLKCLQYFQH